MGWGAEENWTNNQAGLKVASGATFDLWDSVAVSVDALTGAGTVQDSWNVATLSVGAAGGSGSFSGVIQQNGMNLTKNGSGTQTLSGSLYYTGATTVNQGVLLFENVPALFTASFSIASGGTLQVDVPSGPNGQGNVGWETAISGGGVYLKTGAGEWDFLANNATPKSVGLSQGAALIDVEGGTLQLSSGAAQNWTNNQASLKVASGATFDLWDCPAVYVNALAGSGTVVLGEFGDTPTLYVGVAGGSGVFSGLIRNGGSLTKNGSGSETLTGNNTYAGQTTVNAGTLAVNGSLNSDGLVAVQGGTLGGTGNVGTVHIFNGGTLAPGYTTGAGTLTALNVTLDGGSTLDYTLVAPSSSLASSGNSFLNVAGPLTLPQPA